MINKRDQVQIKRKTRCFYEGAMPPSLVVPSPNTLWHCTLLSPSEAKLLAALQALLQCKSQLTAPYNLQQGGKKCRAMVRIWDWSDTIID